MTITRISEKLFAKRREKVRTVLEKEKIGSLVLFNPTSIYYLTGYHFIATERPIAFVLPLEHEPWFFAPRLEQEHLIEKFPKFEREIYFEYPDKTHPARIFVERLKERDLFKKPIGLESETFSAYWGYEGPAITDAIKNQVEYKLFPTLVREMRKIKDKEEIELIKVSAKYGNVAHKLLQQYTEVGENEVNVALRASTEASRIMIKELKDFQPFSLLPAIAGYRGQIGEWSAIPHSVLSGTVFKKGDTLVTGASANVAGYLSELERTMFIGEPNVKQKRYFKVMKKAQDAAIESLRPGVSCAEVDKTARKVIVQEGLGTLLLHHTGHSIGLEGHEPPFLDVGVDEIIKPGMVFTCEPGIYEYKFGGFRHSDTIVITDDGAEVVTTYPRDIDSLII